MIRMPNLQTDRWRIVDAEAPHRSNSKRFTIVPAGARKTLVPGQAVKVILELSCACPEDRWELLRIPIWLLVSERIANGTFFGLCCYGSQTLCPEAAFLQLGAEIPFKAEHVVEIRSPSAGYGNWIMGKKCSPWPRSDRLGSAITKTAAKAEVKLLKPSQIKCRCVQVD